MKTITIRDETYNRLVMLKMEGESFSDVIERLLARERLDLNEFFGCLKDSKILDELTEYSRRFRESARLRV